MSERKLDQILESLDSINERVATLKADVAAIERRVEKHNQRLAIIATQNEIEMLRKAVLELQDVVHEHIPTVHLRESPVEKEEPAGVNARLDQYSDKVDF